MVVGRITITSKIDIPIWKLVTEGRRCAQARGLAFARKGKLVEVANGFEETWQKLSEADKAPLIKEYSALETQDWHTLTLEQKRNSKSSSIPEIFC